MLDNLINIAEGWYNFLNADFHTQQMMKYRLNICDNCPNKVQMSPLGKKIITSIHEEGSTYRCKKCACPLSTKTASPKAKCPEGKWGVAGTEGMY